MLIMVGEGGGIVAGKTRIAILRLVFVARIFAQRAVQPIDGEKRKAVSLNKLPHFFHIHAAREQFGAFGCVDAIEAAVHRWRACNTHMHFGSARFAHHLNDLERGRATHDGIVDQNDLFTRDQIAVCIML